MASPPDFQDPKPDRPNISMGLVVPPPWQTLPVERNSGVRITFTIPFRATDAGEKVLAQLWLNWGLEGERYLIVESWQPQVDVEHEISFQWVPTSDLPVKCQQLTILVTHDSNVPNDANPPKPIDANLTASITWWLNVDADPTDPSTLVDCPVASPEPPSP